MKGSTEYYIILVITLAIYYTGSKLLFDKINKTTTIVIDELFHIPQGLEYCNGNFSYWDPKITTLPGLYLVSAALYHNYFECNTYNLRFTNLLASCVNLLLLSSILNYIYGMSGERHSKIVLQAFNLAILPPLYFFSHVYYTDTLSLTFLLLFSRLSFTHRHKLLILIFSICAVLVRQTNIVWVAMVFGHKVLELLIRTSRVYGNKYLKSPYSRTSVTYDNVIEIDKSKLQRYYGMMDIINAVKFHSWTCFRSVFKLLTLNDLLTLITHSITLLGFITFVYMNGSIVVGDKSAHQATLHTPQLLYFLLFYGVFGLPYVLAKFVSTLKLMYYYKLTTLFTVILLLAIVRYNTVVHPYLLADNRHYTFYVWNRWYGKYGMAKYLSVLAYIYLLFSFYNNLKDQNCISFLLPYSVSLILVLCFQRMIEIRYFLIPYVIARLRFSRPSIKLVLFEFLWYLLLNAATFNVFFSKEIYWKDFDYAQRIIW